MAPLLQECFTAVQKYILSSHFIGCAIHASKGGGVRGGVVASFYRLMLIVFATRKQTKEGEMKKEGGGCAKIFPEQRRGEICR